MLERFELADALECARATCAAAPPSRGGGPRADHRAQVAAGGRSLRRPARAKACSAWCATPFDGPVLWATRQARPLLQFGRSPGAVGGRPGGRVWAGARGDRTPAIGGGSAPRGDLEPVSGDDRVARSGPQSEPPGVCRFRAQRTLPERATSKATASGWGSARKTCACTPAKSSRR